MDRQQHHFQRGKLSLIVSVIMKQPRLPKNFCKDWREHWTCFPVAKYFFLKIANYAEEFLTNFSCITRFFHLWAGSILSPEMQNYTVLYTRLKSTLLYLIWLFFSLEQRTTSVVPWVPNFGNSIGVSSIFSTGTWPWSPKVAAWKAGFARPHIVQYP